MTAEIFTTPSCGYCRMSKDYLKKLGISINEKDIIKNPKYMEEFEKIRGFDKNKIDRILGI